MEPGLCLSSGELGYTLSKAARVGFIEQSRFHSPTSQYGMLTRGPRFVDPELRERMRQGLEEIRSGKFAREWAEEQVRGYPVLTALRQAARSLPLHKLEQRAIRAFWGEKG